MNDSMRLKVKGDTFFLQEPNNVFFRSNTGSFRMEGHSIDQWVEKLIPVLNGTHTLGAITNELPDTHRKHIYHIVGTLLEHEFIRDVSQDLPHRLTDAITTKYETQIEYLDNVAGSGARRFQSYRSSRVLAIGPGISLIQLTSALLESGLPRFHVMFTNDDGTDLSRIEDLVHHARLEDDDVDVKELTVSRGGSPQDIVKQFDAVLYVADNADIHELTAWHDACRRENKIMLPMFLHGRFGIAGPLIHPQSEGCWESAWRRIHGDALSSDNDICYSQTAKAMLANVLVHTLLKCQAGVPLETLTNRIYLLDTETLEGGWHSFQPHPLVTDKLPELQWVNVWEANDTVTARETDEWFSFIGQLNSPVTGILSEWDEGQLSQLPLAQCRVAAADPLSLGPASVLPAVICTGLTHEEARTEAALTGIEAYASRLAGYFLMNVKGGHETRNLINPAESVVIGAGRSTAEAIGRGLRQLLDERLATELSGELPRIMQPYSLVIHDERSLYYMRALDIMGGSPLIGWSEDLSGFPVIWIGSGGRWYASSGLHPTLALRRALKQALEQQQNSRHPNSDGLQFTNLSVEKTASRQLVFAALEEGADAAILSQALFNLESNRERLLVCELNIEPFMTEGIVKLYGIRLKGEVTE